MAEYVKWTFKDAQRNHTLLSRKFAWIMDANAGGQNRRRSFKTLEGARNNRTIANDGRNGRRVARNWDQCCPKEKWAEVVISIMFSYKQTSCFTF